MLDASYGGYGGALLSKSYQKCYDLVENKTLANEIWTLTMWSSLTMLLVELGYPCSRGVSQLVGVIDRLNIFFWFKPKTLGLCMSFLDDTFNFTYKYRSQHNMI